jgi:hypothetical protein
MSPIFVTILERTLLLSRIENIHPDPPTSSGGSGSLANTFVFYIQTI